MSNLLAKLLRQFWPYNSEILWNGSYETYKQIVGVIIFIFSPELNIFFIYSNTFRIWYIMIT